MFTFSNCKMQTQRGAKYPKLVPTVLINKRQQEKGTQKKRPYLTGTASMDCSVAGDAQVQRLQV